MSEEKPHRSLSLAMVVLFVGLLWLGFETWKDYQAGLLVERGPSYLTDTHYWDDGKITIRWKWSRTGVELQDNAGRTKTRCIVHGKITNQSQSEAMRVTSVSLILQNNLEMELDRHSISQFSWLDSDGRRRLAIDALAPGETGQFDFKMYVPKGLLADVSSLSAGLSYVRVNGSDGEEDGPPQSGG